MKEDAIFGAYDGALSQLGVLAGLLISGHWTPVPCICLAVGEMVSMAGGDYLSNDNRKRAGVMGAATFVGAFTLLLPFLFLPQPYSSATCAWLCIGLGAWIAQLRKGTMMAYIQTFSILLTTASLTMAIAFTTSAH